MKGSFLEERKKHFNSVFMKRVSLIFISKDVLRFELELKDVLKLKLKKY